MKRIIKIKEHVLKHVIILFGLALIFMNMKMYEDIGARTGSRLMLRYFIYMHIGFLIASFIEGKIVEYRVKDLGLNHIKPYAKSLLIKYWISFGVLIVISWCTSIFIKVGLLMIMLINTVLLMTMVYVLREIRMYIGYKIMYGGNILVIGNKLYEIEEIKSIRDNFGSNFYMEVGSNKYEIFCGELSTKKELMKILGDKIASKLS